MTTRDALAPASRGRPAPRSPDRPGFALRFEAGRGILSLARPLSFSSGSVAGLELDLGKLPSPIDLRAGPTRFRSRRATLLRSTIRIDLDALASALTERGSELRVLGAEEGAIAIALRDPFRTIALELVPAWDGADLLLALRNVRAAVEGPRSPIGDAMRALLALGASIDGERGALRVSDPVLTALTEALAPHGWRVPEVRGVGRALRIEGRALVITLGVSVPASEGARRALEEARGLAPVLEAIAGDRVHDAERLVLGIETRLGASSHELEAIAGELALIANRALPRLEPAPRRTALLLRAALRDRDAEAAAHHARELAGLERCDDVAIEGLRAAAAVAHETDPATAADLASRALARRPRDPEIALEWLARSSGAPELERVLDGVRAIRATAFPTMRTEVLRACAAIFDRAGAHDEARAIWEEVSRLDPDDALAVEGLARSFARGGRDHASLEAWERLAAMRDGDPDAQARALLKAADRARALGHSAGAAARLERAAATARDDRIRLEVLAALAEIRRELGARAAAEDADAEILALAQRVSGPAMVAALQAASKAALDDGSEIRARAILDALRRAGAPDESVRELARALDALEIDSLEREAPESSELDPAARAHRARTIAERLRAAGRLGDAARALARAGAITRDAATLRAALELAEKAGAWDAALEVVERAIDVVGSGHARAALEARRAAILARQ